MGVLPTFRDQRNAVLCHQGIYVLIDMQVWTREERLQWNFM